MADGQAGQKRQAEAQTLTPDRIEVAKKWLQLVAQARADKTLKQRLMDTPVVVLQEHGMKVRPGLDVRVVENTDKVAYLMLPAAGSELTTKQLDAVVGGGPSLWDILGPSIEQVTGMLFLDGGVTIGPGTLSK
jgi:hypothetical protein